MKPSKIYTEEELQQMPYEEINDKIVPTIENWNAKKKNYFAPASIKQLAIGEYLKSNPQVDEKSTKRDKDQSPAREDNKRDNKVAKTAPAT